jgi:hypothetical protein
MTGNACHLGPDSNPQLCLKSETALLRPVKQQRNNDG